MNPPPRYNPPAPKALEVREPFPPVLRVLRAPAQNAEQRTRLRALEARAIEELGLFEPREKRKPRRNAGGKIPGSVLRGKRESVRLVRAQTPPPPPKQARRPQKKAPAIGRLIKWSDEDGLVQEFIRVQGLTPLSVNKRCIPGSATRPDLVTSEMVYEAKNSLQMEDLNWAQMQLSSAKEALGKPGAFIFPRLPHSSRMCKHLGLTGDIYYPSKCRTKFEKWSAAN